MRRASRAVAVRSGRRARGRGTSSPLSARSVEKIRKPDLVLVLELVERGDRGLLGEVELRRRPPSLGRGITHRAGDVEHEQHACAACAAGPTGRACRSAPSGRAPRAASAAAFGSTPLPAMIGSPTATDGLPGPEAELQHLALVLGLLDEVAGTAPRPASARRVTHGASRMKNGLSEKSVPFLRVDRHERDARRARHLAGVEDAVGVARCCSR